MNQPNRLEAAYAKRREVLGDEYVDRMTAELEGRVKEFQDYLTEMAWGVWTREGPLSTRDRSLLVLAMTAATGRMDEFRLHARASVNAGVVDAEIDELVFQLAAYCGAPAAVSARREIATLRTEGDSA